MKKICTSLFYARRSGISLIETALLLGLILAVLAIVFSGLASFRRISLLNSSAESAVSLLHEARSRTLSSRNASQYGVHFAQDRIVLFKGTNFVAGSAENSETLLPSGIDISVIALNGGGADAVFNRLTGATDQYGSVTFRYAGYSRTLTVSILSTGVVTTQ